MYYIINETDELLQFFVGFDENTHPIFSNNIKEAKEFNSKDYLRIVCNKIRSICNDINYPINNLKMIKYEIEEIIF